MDAQGVFVGKRKIQSNRIIRFLSFVIVLSVLKVSGSTVMGAAGAIRIDEPYHRFLNNGDFFTTPFTPSETIEANFVMMICLKDGGWPGIDETFEVAITTDSEGDNVLTSAQVTDDFGYSAITCDTYMHLFDFDDVSLTGGITYYLRTKVLAGAEGSRAVFSWKGGTLFHDDGMPSNSQKHIVVNGGHTFDNDGDSIKTEFKLDSGIISTAKYVIIEGLDDVNGDTGTETFEVAIIKKNTDANDILLTSAEVTDDFGAPGSTNDGHMHLFDFDDVTLYKSSTYYLRTKVKEGAKVTMSPNIYLYYNEWQRGDYFRMANPPDVDKSYYGHGGKPTCWLAAAANMLAGAGYGTGATVQARANNIYLQLTGNFGTSKAGVPNTALKWWLGSSGYNPGYNPYTAVDVYKTQVALTPWRNPDGPKFITDLLRGGRFVALCVYWPAANKLEGINGHALTYWGDQGWTDGNGIVQNPQSFHVADSDKDDEVNKDDISTYQYDEYTDGGNTNGWKYNGWYFNYSTNHPFIHSVVTLRAVSKRCYSCDNDPPRRMDSSYKAQDPRDGHDIDWARFEAETDPNILQYNIHCSVLSNNEPVINECSIDPNSVSEFTASWDFSDNPVPDGSWITFDVELVLPGCTGMKIKDFNLGGNPIPGFEWEITTPPAISTDEPDITGGYVIGSFDIIDPNGPDVIGQYRFVAQYDYDQNPELHSFSLQGDESNTKLYKAGNFRFGHSYGILEDDLLWSFDEWMTYIPEYYELEPYSQINIELNWETRLPYPKGMDYIGDRIPLLCTEYLDADLNTDCYVDIKDLAVFAQDWLQNTVYESLP